MSQFAIRLNNVSKYYKLYDSPSDRLKEALNPIGKSYHKKYYAINKINLNINKGEILGIVGKNGSGKSTLLKLISSVLVPSEGEVSVCGKISALLELGAGFNPDFTGLDNIRFYATVMGINRDHIESRLTDIIEFADLGEFIDQPLKNYSSGMRARLGFAVSINVDPDILIIDEVLAVGDEAFRRKCYLKMEELFNSGKTVIYVSHNLATVNDICGRAVLLHDGHIILDSKPKIVTAYYRSLVNSTGKDKENLLNKLLLGDNNISTGHNFNESDSYESEYYQEISNITTIKHSKYETEIFDHKLFTESGENVNHLITGRVYEFEYKVRIKSDIGNVNFGFGITNDRGTEISWMFYPEIKSYIDVSGLINEVLTVRCRFECVFSTGIYYLTSTLRNKNEELVAQVRDASVFRVYNPTSSKTGGLIDCKSSIAINNGAGQVLLN